MRKTDPAEIIIGIDTHKEAHAAVAINGLGARLGAMTLLVSSRGYHEMESWAHPWVLFAPSGSRGQAPMGQA